MTKDKSEGVTNINWNVYGKMREVTKELQNPTTFLYEQSTESFYYDASGNRVRKGFQALGKLTYYVRDAQGNVMATYKKDTIGKPIYLENHYIYGSSRIGTFRDTITANDTVTQQVIFERIRGFKSYELSNHLGNVMVVVSDRKVIQSDSTYIADLVSATDYYAFGMVMPDRSINTEGYSRGMNGQEKGDEIHNGHYTAEYWEYDSRIGRRWNLDPKSTFGISDYSCFNSNPIWNTDVLGDKPTPKEAAAITAHVYGDKSDKILVGGWKVSERDFGIKKTAESGLKSQVYERTDTKGVTEYTYATAGTEEARRDGQADVKQVFGASIQYDQSIENARTISNILGKDNELTFTGHSLGGGLASANSYATSTTALKRDAITFNAAGVSTLTIKPNKSSNIDAYIMTTDPLNGAQNSKNIVGRSMPNVDGTRHYVKPPDAASIINGHSMDNMLKAFEVKMHFMEFQKSKPSGLDSYPSKPFFPISN